jgi:hypothetical protein
MQEDGDSRTRQPQQQKQRSRSAATSCRPGADSTDIPQPELRRVQALVRRVHRWRGWSGGPYALTLAWQQVEAAALAPDGSGGGWSAQFGGAQLTPAACDTLLRVLDAHFFGGRLLRKLDTAHQQRQQQQQLERGSNSEGAGSAPPPASPSSPGGITCQVVQSYDARWLAYFNTADNAVYINCWRWAKEVTPAQPWNFEGAVCRSRLQLLLHTLAHELVHAAVYHLLPDIDAASAAYTSNERHGPIFALLNKQLFGHTSDALQPAVACSPS